MGAYIFTFKLINADTNEMVAEITSLSAVSTVRKIKELLGCNNVKLIKREEDIWDIEKESLFPRLYLIRDGKI